MDDTTSSNPINAPLTGQKKQNTSRSWFEWNTVGAELEAVGIPVYSNPLSEPIVPPLRFQRKSLASLFDVSQDALELTNLASYLLVCSDLNELNEEGTKENKQPALCPSPNCETIVSTGYGDPFEDSGYGEIPVTFQPHQKVGRTSHAFFENVDLLHSSFNLRTSPTLHPMLSDLHDLVKSFLSAPYTLRSEQRNEQRLRLVTWVAEKAQAITLSESGQNTASIHTVTLKGIKIAIGCCYALIRHRNESIKADSTHPTSMVPTTSSDTLSPTTNCFRQRRPSPHPFPRKNKANIGYSITSVNVPCLESPSTPHHDVSSLSTIAASTSIDKLLPFSKPKILEFTLTSSHLIISSPSSMDQTEGISLDIQAPLDSILVSELKLNSDSNPALWSLSVFPLKESSCHSPGGRWNVDGADMEIILWTDTLMDMLIWEALLKGNQLYLWPSGSIS